MAAGRVATKERHCRGELAYHSAEAAAREEDGVAGTGAIGKTKRGGGAGDRSTRPVERIGEELVSTEIGDVEIAAVGTGRGPVGMRPGIAARVLGATLVLHEG